MLEETGVLRENHQARKVNDHVFVSHKLCVRGVNCASFYCFESYYTPRNEVVGGYTGFTMYVRPSVDKSYGVR